MKTMTIEKFLEEYNKKNKPSNDKVIDEICKRSKVRKIFTLALSQILYAQKVFAISNDTKINNAGSMLLSVVRTFGYWICLIMCIVEIIKSLLQGDTRSIGKIVAKYVLAFGAFYFMPWLFDIIKEAFK